MHHPDPSSESPGSRRMSHPSVLSGRRASNTVSGSAVHAEDVQTPAMMSNAGSASPGPHHPPHSLSIHPQSQAAGAQMKKKSGFQITSVLPAQVSASANNSVADDTESYDDLDESHTEDISTSDMLDVSVSRATDTGIPERSSSEETLNSFHGVDTPGVTSPNEPVMNHPQQGYMVNGVHHHHHPHSHQQHGPLKGRTVPPVTVAPAASAAPQAHGQTGPPAQAASVEASGTTTLIYPSTVVIGGAVASPVDTGGVSGPPAGVKTTVGSQQPPPSSQPQTAAAATASRFRVVKLDSNSEPFRKGRWTCTEYYEKEAPCGDQAAAHKAVETTTVQSELESSSTSSSESSFCSAGENQPHLPHFPAASVGSEAPVRPPVSYNTEPNAQTTFSTSAKAALEFGHLSANIQPVTQTLPVPSIPNAVSPRGVPGPIGISGLLVGAQSVPLRPWVPVTAAQLEDARRVLRQHHSLLSLPRLTAGVVSGLDSAATLGMDSGSGAEGAFVGTAGTDEDSSSGASVVAIDNKIEQAMDLVKSHLMYAVREEVEVLKEQIKELMERNSQLEQENTLLKNLASPEQLVQFQAQVQAGSPTSVPQTGPLVQNPAPGAST